MRGPLRTCSSEKAVGQHRGRGRVRGCDRSEADDAKLPETSKPRAVLWMILGAWTWIFEQIEAVLAALLGLWEP